MDNLDKDKTITITIGKLLSMYGVNDIRAFDGGYISLDTTSGQISVEGDNLKIESLSKEDGRILITGNISGVFCDTDVKEKKGFVKRILGR